MKKLILLISGVIVITLFLSSCAPIVSTAHFPSPDEIFITSGDGDIQKPYTPVGELIYMNSGFRVPIPILCMIPIKDVDPDMELREGVYNQVRNMGGDALINMRIGWEPPKNYFLFATGGNILITGTVIKR